VSCDIRPAVRKRGWRPRNKLQATFRRVQAAGFGIALVTESARSVTVANVVYREIVDYQRVFDFVLAYRTRERAPAVLAFIETCKGLQARSRPEKEPRI
jgi:LysR substrate binding domain